MFHQQERSLIGKFKTVNISARRLIDAIIITGIEFYTQ